MNYNIELSGKRISDLRKKTGLSQTALSEKIGIHEKTIGKAERGINGLSVDNLVQLSSYFGVTIDYLVGIQNEDDDRYILSLYQQCPKERRKLLVEVMKSFLIE